MSHTCRRMHAPELDPATCQRGSPGLCAHSMLPVATAGSTMVQRGTAMAVEGRMHATATAAPRLCSITCDQHIASAAGRRRAWWRTLQKKSCTRAPLRQDVTRAGGQRVCCSGHSSAGSNQMGQRASSMCWLADPRLDYLLAAATLALPIGHSCYT